MSNTEDSSLRDVTRPIARRKESSDPARTTIKQRASGALRVAVPIMQRLLPLLDGNIGSTVSNLLNPHAPTPAVSLAAVEEALADLATQNHHLSLQLAEQAANTRLIEGQLERLQQITVSTAREQHELLDDLKSVANKVNIFSFIAVTLLGVSVIMNLFLFLQLRVVLHAH